MQCNGYDPVAPHCAISTIIPLKFNKESCQNSTIGSNWIDLKCGSKNVLTNLPPLTKQTPTEGLVQLHNYLSVHASLHLPDSQIGMSV